MSAVIIYNGSSRYGDILEVVLQLRNKLNLPAVDLHDYSLVDDFEEVIADREEAFSELLTTLLEYDSWIITVPNEWFSVNHAFARFFERVVDFLSIDGKLKSRTRDKHLHLVCAYRESRDHIEEFVNTNWKTLCTLGMLKGSRLDYYVGADSEVLAKNKTYMEDLRTKLS